MTTRSGADDQEQTLNVDPIFKFPANWCGMGVGDGSGKLFVYGDYESIKAAQSLVLAAGRVRDLERSVLILTNKLIEAGEYLTYTHDEGSTGEGWDSPELTALKNFIDNLSKA